MNAPDNIARATYPVNLAHEVLLKSNEAMCVDQVAQAIVGKKPTKAEIKSVAKLLKELADLGLIEMRPRTGGVSFYHLFAEPKADMGIPITESTPAEDQSQPLNFATSPEVQYLAPEDYEMPPADPALLAMANRALSEQLDEYRGQLAHIATTAADYLPDPSNITTARAVEIMDMLIEAQRGQIDALSAKLLAKDNELFIQAKVVVDLRDRLDALTQQWEADTGRITADLRAALNKAINEADRLRRELTDAQEVTEAAVGYLVRAPKRKPRYIVKPERAREAALAAVRAGAGRADVLAVVPVGVARRGAEWQGINPQPSGD